MKNENTIGSLFSGIGGIELGFEKQGFRTEWFVENDKYAKAVLKRNFKETPIYGDITQLDFSKLPKVDVITGGFPCQDISPANTKRKGIYGKKSGLWKFYFEAIRVLRPRIAFIENHTDLTIKGLHIVLADLASIGYDAEWYPLPAWVVGNPQARERLFIIAYPNCTTIKQETKRERRINLSERSEIWTKLTTNMETQDWKEIASRFCGSIHGISNWVDKYRCLGNAVVPQVAEVFAIAINEILTARDFNPLNEESLISVKRESADSPNTIGF